MHSPLGVGKSSSVRPRVMLGSELQGQVVDFHPTANPPGGRAFTLSGRIIADFVWSREERAVRIEALDDVWWGRFSAGHIFGGVIEAVGGAPQMLYGGGLVTGVALARSGAKYELFVASDWRHGAWAGIDDAEGMAVLRARRHFGRYGSMSEVELSPEARHCRDLWPLLLLWGSLSIVKERRPFRGMLSLRTSRRAAEQALSHVLDALM